MDTQTDRPLDERLAELLSLDRDERATLALALLESLDDGDEAGVEAAWTDEVRRRCDALRDGYTAASPWAEARARLAAM